MVVIQSITSLVTTASALCLLTLSWNSQISQTNAFITTTNPPSRSTTTSLYGIQEWRQEARRNEQMDEDDDNEVVGELPIHLMDASKVALQGEKVYLQFTRDDEVKLFQQAVDSHHGVFGLGFLSTTNTSQDDDAGEAEIMYDTISLVEIQDFNLMGDDFGIFLVAQVVGRALVLQTNSNEDNAPTGKGMGLAPDQPLQAICEEIYNREELKTLQEATKMAQDVISLVNKVCQVEQQQQRTLLNQDADCDDSDEETRMDRFRTAVTQAMHSQKFQGGFQDDGISSEWDALDAISWAAFSTSDCLVNDQTFRLAALDNHCLTNRLQLAKFWLSDVLKDIKQRIIQ